MIRDYHEVRYGHYTQLSEYLRAGRTDETIRLTFEQIETILGRSLPAKARTDGRGWWTINPTAVQARSWLGARRHPHVMNGYVDFVPAQSLTWRAGGDNLRITLQQVGHARDRLNDGNFDEKRTQEIHDRWWEPHVVYLLHYPEVNLFKVGLTHAASERVRALARAGGIVADTTEVANRFVATILEGECLILADEYRAEPPLWIAQVAGATEFWLDTFVLDSLEQILGRIGGDGMGDAWTTSIARSESSCVIHD